MRGVWGSKSRPTPLDLVICVFSSQGMIVSVSSRLIYMIFLQLVNLAQSWGSPPRFTIRMAASVADVAATFVVFELLRRRRPLPRRRLMPTIRILQHF